MQQEVCSHEVSLGSLSDMQHVVDPQLLAGVTRFTLGPLRFVPWFVIHYCSD